LNSLPTSARQKGESVIDSSKGFLDLAALAQFALQVISDLLDSMLVVSTIRPTFCADLGLSDLGLEANGATPSFEF
jgi:hypothetical protein